MSYTDGQGRLGEGRWSKQRVVRGVESVVPRPSNLVMAVAPPASKDRARFLVEKLGELGIARLAWLSTSNAAGRIPSIQKQRAWASSALEQSRGAWLLETTDALTDWADLEGPLVVCVPSGIEEFGGVRAGTVAVGPEGGFDEDEIPDSATRVSLGGTILRVETAAIVAAANFR